MVINGQPVDFADAGTYYLVSTVNYLAAGSCNFNDNGVSLWPLNQIVNDTQLYVRDAVIDYIHAMGSVSPMIEGRLHFITDRLGPAITIASPAAATYLHTDALTLDFSAVDVGDAGLKAVWADLDGVAVDNAQVVDLFGLAVGDHTLTVTAVDLAGNEASQSVTFTVVATLETTAAGLNRLYSEGQIDNRGIYNSLSQKLANAQAAIVRGKPTVAINRLEAFINEVQAQSGVHITAEAAELLLADARWVIAHLQ